MKTTHTPGPWETDYLDQNKLDGNSPCRVRAQKRTVAWVDFWQDESYATQLQMNEQKANARLIAAAPELLEACKAICEAVSDCLPISGKGKVDALYYKAKLLAIDQAAAICSQAISKAEGNYHENN